MVTKTLAPAPLSRADDVIKAAGRKLASRRGLLVLGALIILLGVALNWSWLAALGIAPLLLSLLPCVAMCALGLCMHKMSGRSDQNSNQADKA